MNRAVLVRHAQELTLQLSRFRTPNWGTPVDPSIPAQVLRFLRNRPALAELDAFLDALPSSSVGTLTQSSGPQAREVALRVRALAQHLAREAPEPEAIEALTYVLAWTRRLLVAQEREGGARRQNP